MDLAVVVGQCTATVKDTSLNGRKLALVRRTDIDGSSVGEVEVALDVTGAGPGHLVLLVRGSAARQPVDVRQIPADLAIVAIVDEVTTTSVESSDAPSSVSTDSRTNKRVSLSTEATQTRKRGK